MYICSAQVQALVAVDWLEHVMYPSLSVSTLDNPEAIATWLTRCPVTVTCL